MDIYNYLNIDELIQIKEEVSERLGLTFQLKDYLLFHINEIMIKYMFEFDISENRESFSATIEKNIYNKYTRLPKEDVKIIYKDDVFDLVIQVSDSNYHDLLNQEINITKLLKIKRKQKLDSLNVRTVENRKNTER